MYAHAHSPPSPASCQYRYVHAGFIDQSLSPKVHIPLPFLALPRALTPSRQYVYTRMTLSAHS